MKSAAAAVQVLRQTAADFGPQLHAAGLTIDLESREVRLRSQRIQLTRIEYELLVALAVEPRRVIARPELLGRIWGYEPGCATRTLDTHASRLRRRLGRIDGGPWIVNVRGVGYRLT